MACVWLETDLAVSLGGVTKVISPILLFSDFFSIVKNRLAIEYHVYTWQVSPQPNYGDTCQIWMISK